jgi:hypothetical protein
LLVISKKVLSSSIEDFRIVLTLLFKALFIKPI